MKARPYAQPECMSSGPIIRESSICRRCFLMVSVTWNSLGSFAFNSCARFLRLLRMLLYASNSVFNALPIDALTVLLPQANLEPGLGYRCVAGNGLFRPLQDPDCRRASHDQGQCDRMAQLIKWHSFMQGFAGVVSHCCLRSQSGSDAQFHQSPCLGIKRPDRCQIVVGSGQLWRLRDQLRIHAAVSHISLPCVSRPDIRAPMTIGLTSSSATPAHAISTERPPSPGFTRPAPLHRRFSQQAWTVENG